MESFFRKRNVGGFKLQIWYKIGSDFPLTGRFSRGAPPPAHPFQVTQEAVNDP